MHKKRRSMRALIVGASGFIGRHLSQACLDTSWHVDGVVHKNRAYVPHGIATFSMAELDRKPRAYDVIIIATGNFRSPVNELLDANVVIPQRIVQRFPDSKIIFISSVAVYGTHTDIVTLQSDFRNPSPYGLSKIAGEFVVATHKYGSSIRLSNVYGEGMDTGLFIAKAIKEAQASGTVTLFGDGSRIQDYLYVRDAVRFILAASVLPRSGVYLGASGVSVFNREVAKVICGIIPNTKVIYKGSDHAASLRLDPQESFAALGFTCEYSLEKGLRDMISHHA